MFKASEPFRESTISAGEGYSTEVGLNEWELLECFEYLLVFGRREA